MQKVKTFIAAGVAALMLHEFPFLFQQWSLHYTHLSWDGEQPWLQTSVYLLSSVQLFFFCNVAFLLGGTSNITGGTLCESHGVCQGLSYCTKHKKNMWELWGITFYCNMQLERRIALVRWLESQGRVLSWCSQHFSNT